MSTVNEKTESLTWVDVYLRVGDHGEYRLGRVPQADGDERVRPEDIACVLMISARKIAEVVNSERAREQAS